MCSKKFSPLGCSKNWSTFQPDSAPLAEKMLQFRGARRPPLCPNHATPRRTIGHPRACRFNLTPTAGTNPRLLGRPCDRTLSASLPRTTRILAKKCYQKHPRVLVRSVRGVSFRSWPRTSDRGCVRFLTDDGIIYRHRRTIRAIMSIFSSETML